MARQRIKRNQTPTTYVIGGAKDRDKLLPINANHLVRVLPKTKNQSDVLNYYDDNFNLVLMGCPGSGKSFLALYLALKSVLDVSTPHEKVVIVRSTVPTRNQGFLPGCQPYHSKVLTPTGWRTMGDIQPGDYVTSKSGSAVKVLETFEKGVKPVYKITTEQGKSTECCADHIWYTTTAEQKKRGKLGTLKSTSDIISTINDNKVNSGYTNHYLPINGIVEYDKRDDIKIPSYTLGVLLGDGSLSDSICFSSIDIPIVEKVRNELNALNYKVTNINNSIQYNISSVIDKPNKCSGTYTVGDKKYNLISDMCVEFPHVQSETLKTRCYSESYVDGNKYSYEPPTINYTNNIKQSLDEYDLLYKRAWDKHIPDDYKYGTIYNRIELIRGLMDTDGTIKKSTGETSYTTTSETLALDIQEIVRSLGGRCTIYTRDRIGKTTYIGERPCISRRISYELCINVNFVPFSLERKSKHWKLSKFVHQDGIKNVEYLYDMPVKCILIDDEEHLYITDDFIVTHNTSTEKEAVYELPYKSIVRELIVPSITGDIYEKLKAQKSIEFISTSYVRGITLDNCIIVVDEFSNLTMHENDSIITRIGKNCKIIFSGDTRQSDLGNDKLEHTKFLEIISNMIEFRTVAFTVDDIIRSGLVKSYIIAKENLGY